jgi:hypothetical protein
MKCWIAVACTLAFVLAAPWGGEAEAAYGRKRCIAPATHTAGRVKTTWICKASEKCCYDWLARRGTCTSRCL